VRDIFPYLDRPFAFFGHSMGGIISFELARHLRRKHGIEPDHLFISGRRAPQLPEEDPQIHELPEREFLAEVERLNGTPKEVLANAELQEIIVPLLRADFAACHTYTYLPGPLCAPLSPFPGRRPLALELTSVTNDLELLEILIKLCAWYVAQDCGENCVGPKRTT
jgi:medium-chain acyl-[acyl-carrier-protein] hydrolase